MRFSELITIYLFMGGTAAGSFAVLATVDLYRVVKTRVPRLPAPDGSTRHRARLLPASDRREQTYQRIRTVTYATSLIAVAIGSLCLIADLGKPGNFYYLFLYPTATFISIGAFALVTLAICATISLADASLVLGPAFGHIALVAKIVGIPAAMATMIYTGFLLESMVSVPMWQSLWLPVLFTTSALSCGCAVVMISVCMSENTELVTLWGRRLSFLDAGLILAEIVSLTFFLLNILASSPSALTEMIVGQLAPVYWLGFVGGSLVAPLCIELAQMLSCRKFQPSILGLTASMVLLGGLCLRLALVSAGVQVVS